MPTQLKQSPQHPSGTAAFVVVGPAARQLETLDGLQLSIVQTGQVDRYLDPRLPDDPWTTAVYRFYPRNPSRDEKTVTLEVDEGVTYYLRANQPYKLILWRAGGKEIVEIFSHPAGIRQVSKPPIGWPRVPDAALSSDVAEQLPDAEDAAAKAAREAAEQAARAKALQDEEEARRQREADAIKAEGLDDDEIVSPPPLPEPKKSKKLLWLVLLLMVLAALVGGYLYWKQLQAPKPPDSQNAEPAPAPAPTASACQTVKDADTARVCLRGDPDASAARSAAEALTKSGAPLEPQLMLYKYAGDKGDPVAARIMGTYNDPDTWAKETSPMEAPNGNAAARWHKIAADAGDAESQYRYGMLLKKGRTDEPNGPEMAVQWLKMAADQGHEAAKKELGL